ncbi:MAG: site-specific integrase [Campylobacterota bacterium]|nr:site-specific integrase [Campylobacterota bacterium]
MGKKLLEILRDKIRVKHYSISTERTYLFWVKSYILFHNKRDPKEMSKVEIEEFLIHLAVEKNIAPTTQN